jgi:poly(3-hydroxybutyrate) depolymerase
VPGRTGRTSSPCNAPRVSGRSSRSLDARLTRASPAADLRGAGTRTYYAWVPKVYTNGSGPVPLLFAFHGLGDDCLNFGPAVGARGASRGCGLTRRGGTGFQEVAEQKNFIYVYPCSTSGILGSCWNAGMCCCAGENVDGACYAATHDARAHAHSAGRLTSAPAPPQTSRSRATWLR